MNDVEMNHDQCKKPNVGVLEERRQDINMSYFYQNIRHITKHLQVSLFRFTSKNVMI